MDFYCKGYSERKCLSGIVGGLIRAQYCLYQLREMIDKLSDPGLKDVIEIGSNLLEFWPSYTKISNMDLKDVDSLSGMDNSPLHFHPGDELRLKTFDGADWCLIIKTVKYDVKIPYTNTIYVAYGTTIMDTPYLATYCEGGGWNRVVHHSYLSYKPHPYALTLPAEFIDELYQYCPLMDITRAGLQIRLTAVQLYEEARIAFLVTECGLPSFAYENLDNANLQMSRWKRAIQDLICHNRYWQAYVITVTARYGRMLTQAEWLLALKEKVLRGEALKLAFLDDLKGELITLLSMKTGSFGDARLI